MAIIAGKDSGIVKGDLKTLKGKKIAASFGTINYLYVLGRAGEGRAHAERRHARQHAAA